MTPQHRSPAGIGDTPLWHTNPVWCVEQLRETCCATEAGWLSWPQCLAGVVRCLVDRGVPLPASALRHWANEVPNLGAAATPGPGVIGLVVNKRIGTAWVTPLTARAAPTWSVAPNVPIRTEVLQDLLVRLVLALGLPQAPTVPERLAFAIDDQLGDPADGPSMYVAGLLAVLDATNNRPAELRRACAVVQPAGGGFIPCGSVREKLAAFVREYETGTLLVRTHNCREAAAFDSSFDRVWEVDTISDLANKAANLLGVFYRSAPLGRNDVTVSLGYLRKLAEAHRYSEALGLGRRLLACPREPDVPVRSTAEVGRTVADLYRHLGFYNEAAELAGREAGAVRDSAYSCYDEQARAEVCLAAALYDPHRFADAEHLLAPWHFKLAQDPRIVAPETRVMLLNTLARVRSARNIDGWRELFEEALRIQFHRDSRDLPRTQNYLAHAFLRVGQPDEAQMLLSADEPATDEMSRWMRRFLRAELARQRGDLWTDDEMEHLPLDASRPGHPFGLYFQATARQGGRPNADASSRFRRAAEFFKLDASGGDGPNITQFLWCCVQLAADITEGAGLSRKNALELLAHQLSPRPGSELHQYYTVEWEQVNQTLDPTSVERFLRRVPFF